tara:strand:+ start:354 stop:1886 length:1533 start_codon:yes stop_codon:yes gene_type:complete
MADKVVLEAEIKSNIGAVSKETKELTNEFGAFGITIGGIKDKFKDVAKIMNNGLKQVALQARLAGVGFKKMFSGNIIGGAKTLFSVIKTGIAATGIGALVLAFVSLAAYFTQTKKGAELLEKTLKTVGAAVSVITDRVATLGGAVIKFFKGDLKGAAEDAKAAVSGIVAEVKEEVDITMKMVDANQKLRDAQRELNVETAKSVADIEKLKLIAEDITKTYAEREEAATAAFEKETALENKRIKLAEQAVKQEKIRQSIMGKDGVMAEDLDALAELEINLANVRQESAGRQISLQNFLNGLRQTEKDEKEAQRLKEQEEEEAAFNKKIEENNKWNEEQQKSRELNIAADKKAADDKKKIEDAKMSMQVDMANQGLQIIGNAAGEGTALAKAAAIAQATISGVQGVQNAFTAANANIGATAGSFGVYPVTMATLAGTFAAMNIAKIASGGGGGASTPSVPSAPAQAPAPQMMSGAFELSGGVAPEAMKAFVVTDEMTNSQNQLANIRRRATI